MTHKVENAVDLDSGAILSIEVQPSDQSDAIGMAGDFETAARRAQSAADQTDGRVFRQTGNFPKPFRPEPNATALVIGASKSTVS